MTSVSTVQEKWTREATRLLIELYREEQCLWNVMTVVYRNRDKKSASLRRIAEHMSGTGVSFSVENVRKKIDTLRNQHRRELRQVCQSMKSGAGHRTYTNQMYFPTTFYTIVSYVPFSLF